MIKSSQACCCCQDPEIVVTEACGLINAGTGNQTQTIFNSTVPVDVTLTVTNNSSTNMQVQFNGTGPSTTIRPHSSETFVRTGITSITVSSTENNVTVNGKYCLSILRVVPL